MAQESAISTRGSKPTRQDQVNQVNLSVESSCLPRWEIIFLVREPHVTPSCMKGEVVGTEEVVGTGGDTGGDAGKCNDAGTTFRQMASVPVVKDP